MMLFYWVLFFFVTVVAKLVMANLLIYWLLPNYVDCNECDGETVRLQGGRVERVLSLVFMGRIERRWCPHCKWEGFTRPLAIPVEPAMAREARERVEQSDSFPRGRGDG